MSLIEKHSIEEPPCLEPPPLLGAGQALFLDVDGTLLELAPTPAEVVVPPGLPLLLQDLGAALQGAIAYISGRRLAVVDQLLAPWRPGGAGIHGAELRLPDGREIHASTAMRIAVAPWLRLLLAPFPQVLIEDKGGAVAVHYARCPQLRTECEAALNEAIREVPGLRVQQGRFVLEALPAEADKGSALQTLMRHAPYAGRQPVFIGDDRTDEAAFAAVRAAGGIGVKVGTGLTLASHRLPDPPAVWQWLRSSLAHLCA